MTATGPSYSSRRPKIVALGGGHGLAQTLTAAKRYAASVTAVVSVADNGGSSKVFRDELNIPAVGDMRRCLLALADGENLLAQAMSYRFPEGAFANHPVGNFLLAGLYEMTDNLESASREFGKSLNIKGNVLPACNSNVTLVATTESGEEITGQTAIVRQSDISSVRLTGSDVNTPESVIAAIGEADQIIVGPGSLYTSLLAALGAGGIREAFTASRAQKIYIANLHAQNYETLGYSVADHVNALLRHGIECEVILLPLRHEMELGKLPKHVGVFVDDLSDGSGAIHDPSLLGKALQKIWYLIETPA